MFTEAKIPPPLRWRERPPVPHPMKSRTVSGFVITGPSSPSALIMALVPAELGAGCEPARAGGSGVIGETGAARGCEPARAGGSGVIGETGGSACGLLSGVVLSGVVLSGVAGPSPGAETEPAAAAAGAGVGAGAEAPHADTGLRGAAVGAAADAAAGAAAELAGAAILTK
jgi:hypothetical protein